MESEALMVKMKCSSAGPSKRKPGGILVLCQEVIQDISNKHGAWSMSDGDSW